ncbi:MAG: hypothetical protein ACEPOZ_06155 [Marinifilaceae bacterium]
MSNIDNQQEQLENISIEKNYNTSKMPNLFEGITDPEIDGAKFPDWDIVPPNQFINPRIKDK